LPEAAAPEEADEALAAVLEEEPPQAASRLAAPTAVHRLNGLFAHILRCLPLQSVRIAAENRLVCGQKSSPIRRTLAMNPASKG